jgi:hypothetical protein
LDLYYFKSEDKKLNLAILKEFKFSCDTTAKNGAILLWIMQRFEGLPTILAAAKAKSNGSRSSEGQGI